MLTVGDLRAHLQSGLPAHMIPSIFVELDRLPRRPNGKVDRNALPSPDSGRLGSGEPFAAPRTPMEATLARLWAEVLGVERTSIHDGFFDLGGTSLKATRLLAAIERAVRPPAVARDALPPSDDCQPVRADGGE